MPCILFHCRGWAISVQVTQQHLTQQVRKQFPQTQHKILHFQRKFSATPTRNGQLGQTVTETVCRRVCASVGRKIRAENRDLKKNNHASTVLANAPTIHLKSLVLVYVTGGLRIVCMTFSTIPGQRGRYVIVIAKRGDAGSAKLISVQGAF